MLAWLKDNISAIIICAALIAVIAAIIVGMVKNKKKGKSACDCGCVLRSEPLYFCYQILLDLRLELLRRSAAALPASPLYIQTFRPLFEIDPFP